MNFTLPPTNLILARDDVHVWSASLAESSSYLQLVETLSPDEQNRANRFHFERDRQHFIAARGILRNILSRYLHIEANQIQFVYSSRGKPALAEISDNNRKLSFNVSHSQDLALYAVTIDRKIGIDIEYIRSMSDAEQIVHRFFCENEKSIFSSLPPHQKQTAFFRAWTQKEAYLKATGDGLAGHLDQIEVSIKMGESTKLLSINGNREAADCWLLQELICHPDYVATLAVEAVNCHIHCWEWKL